MQGYQKPNTMQTKSSKIEKLNVLKKVNLWRYLQIKYLFQMLILCPKLKGWDEKETSGKLSGTLAY